MILKTNLLGVQQTLHKRKVKQSTPKMVAMNIINTVIASLAVVVFSKNRKIKCLSSSEPTGFLSVTLLSTREFRQWLFSIFINRIIFSLPLILKNWILLSKWKIIWVCRGIVSVYLLVWLVWKLWKYWWRHRWRHRCSKVEYRWCSCRNWELLMSYGEKYL